MIPNLSILRTVRHMSITTNEESAPLLEALTIPSKNVLATNI